MIEWRWLHPGARNAFDNRRVGGARSAGTRRRLGVEAEVVAGLRHRVRGKPRKHTRYTEAHCRAHGLSACGRCAHAPGAGDKTEQRKQHTQWRRHVHVRATKAGARPAGRAAQARRPRRRRRQCRPRLARDQRPEETGEVRVFLLCEYNLSAVVCSSVAFIGNGAPTPRCDGGVRGWCMARPVYVARDPSQQDALQDNKTTILNGGGKTLSSPIFTAS
eukprot:scaffold40263_cov31-Tisochrysis_lutea.AAC.3